MGDARGNVQMSRVRALMHEPPSWAAWREMIGALMGAEGDTLEVMVDYLCAHMCREREAWAKVATGLPGRWYGKSVVEEPGLRVWEALGCPAVRMRLVEGGEFEMGSPEGELGRADNEKLHKVRLSGDYWMMSTPVTQELYEAVMGWNPSNFKGAKRPVESVSWYDAVKFCNGLSRQEGYEEAYEIEGEDVRWKKGANGYRLPTEAEWEKACRAGTRTAMYGGDLTSDDGECDVLNEIGWYLENSGGEETKAVGLKAPNGYGLNDMLGNVYEWCWDEYVEDHKSLGIVDPVGGGLSKSSGAYRVARGGSWRSYAGYCRSAYRGSSRPVFRLNGLGFRVSRSDH